MRDFRSVASAFARSWFTRDLLVPFVVTRTMLVAVAWLAFQAFQGISPGPGTWEVKPKGGIGPVGEHLGPYSRPLLNVWVRWDAGWYQSLAKHGYKFVAGEQSNTAFFPAYPLTIRAVHALVGGRTDASWFVSGLIASNLALLGALFYLVRLVRLDADEQTAARAALYLLVFPTTFFLSSVYTESLFILVAVAAFYHARKGQWLAAGAFGGLAALTRSPGILLAAPLTVEYLAQREFQLRKVRGNILWLALIPAALGGLMLYFHFRFGNFNAVRDAQASWGRGWGEFRGPWYPFYTATQRSLAAHEWVDLAFTLLALAMAVVIALRFRWSYGVYAVVCSLFLVSWGSAESMPRYILVIFPIFIAFAIWGRNELFHRTYLMLGSGFAALFMIEFALWRWVG